MGRQSHEPFSAAEGPLAVPLPLLVLLALSLVRSDGAAGRGGEGTPGKVSAFSVAGASQMSASQPVSEPVS